MYNPRIPNSNNDDRCMVYTTISTTTNSQLSNCLLKTLYLYNIWHGLSLFLKLRRQYATIVKTVHPSPMSFDFLHSTSGQAFFRNIYIHLLFFVFTSSLWWQHSIYLYSFMFFFAINHGIYLLEIWVLRQTITHSPFVAWKYIINIVYII